jgi:hypothetical protein
MTWLRAAALAGCAGLAAVPAARAAAPQVALLSPFSPPRASPPLRVVLPPGETRFFGRLASTQSVTVSIDPAGRPARLVDVDRILISRKGDYSFAIGAPALDARRAAGSESEPGLRSRAVVWQGFSPNRRLLAAAITLRTGEAASSLPLRIEVGKSGIRLVNATAASVPAVDAPTRASEVARALDAAKAALEAHIPTPTAVVAALGPTRGVRIGGVVPLRVAGAVRFEGEAAHRVAATVGSRVFSIPGKGTLRSLELSVTVPEPASRLRPPAGRRWADLARAGTLRSGRATTRLANERLLGAALATQFNEFLANPDASGTSRTSYRYELVQAAARGGGLPARHSRAWVAVALALGLASAAVAAIVAWAHS